MNRLIKNVSFGLILLGNTICLKSTQAQSLKHPAIYVTNEERPQILEKIKNYDWAKSIVRQLHERVDAAVSEHQKNPRTILNTIPAFAKHDRENSEQKAGPLADAHNKVLSLAENAGTLYYLTKEDKYAQFTADILTAYIDHIAPLTPQTTTICGYEFFDPRTTYGPFAVAYDFIYNFLKQPNTKVFSKIEGKYVNFNNARAQKAVANMAGNVLQEYGKPDQHGKMVSNHPILTASGALFNILCIDDDKERERLFNIFWEKGTAHQNSFKHTILPMFGDQGIWPESTSYSFMPIISLVLNIVDRVYPEMDVTKDYNYILEGNFLFDYLRYPNRKFVRFGDAKRNNDGTEDLYRYTLSIAERRGYKELQQKAEIALKQTYDARGGYKPKLTDVIFNNFQLLDLFWGTPIPDKIESEINFNKPTVLVKHAGVALQRNYVENNNDLYGLCGIIGGAHYVHSHATGIAMELYGAGYVMGPNAGLPASVAERQIPLHENYFRLYAGNNTVIVNGSSHGKDEGAWKGNAFVWQNTTVNIAAEPKHLQNPIAKNFNFATQFLKDEVNNCNQERTLGILRTSDKTGYYFDMFRSKSNTENKFHDYIYHNIGDETIVQNSQGKAFELQKTDRYKTDIADPVQSPGWKYFENTQVTKPTNEAVKIRFDLNENNRYMHLFMPSGVQREYTTALAPATREGENSYLKKKTQVIAVRQQGEAWDRPYIAIFEPSLSQTSSIQSVEPLTEGNRTIGAKVISKVGKSVFTDYIICQDKPDAVYQNNAMKLKFNGRYGVVRMQEWGSQQKVSLYIGEGSEMVFGKYILKADTDRKAFKEFE